MRQRLRGLFFVCVALLGCASCSDAPQESHLERALRLQSSGDLPNAISEIHAAVSASPDDANIRRHAAFIYLAAGDAAAADAAFRHAIDLGIEVDDEFNLGLARALFLQNEHAQALEVLKATSFSTNETELPAEILIAKCLDQIGDNSEAKRRFLEILKQFDRQSFPHEDPVDTAAMSDALRGDREHYRSLAAAYEYHDWLNDLPIGTWVTLHQQSSLHDKVFFGRQNHGGSAFDSKRGVLVLFGSDTHDYGDIAGMNWKNNLFFFDPSVAVWTQSYPMDPVKTYTVNEAGIPVAGEHGDHPWAMHTYGAVAYDARRDQIVVASYPAHEEPGKFTYVLQEVWPRVGRHPTWLFDLTSNRWTPLEAPAESFFQNAVAYDSDRDVVVGYKRSGVFELSGSPRAWHRIFDKGLLGPDNNIVYDSKHKALIVFGSVPLSNDIAIYEPATRRHQIMPTTGLRPPKYRFAPMAFHPRLGKTVILVERREPGHDQPREGVTETWLYDLGTDSWQQVASATLDYGISRNYNLAYDTFHDFLLLVPNPYGPLSLTTVLALRL